jgi:hypothetical protein
MIALHRVVRSICMASINAPEGSWHNRADLSMAGLGLISGILSVTWGMNDLSNSWMQPVASLFGLSPELVPIGFFFGTVVALSMWRWTGSRVAVPVMLVVTMYAWSAAIQVAIRTQRHVDDDPHLIAASLGAGAVGAGITHLGCALFAPELRRPMRILTTIVVGAVAGLLLYLSQRKFVDERLLYLVWQPAVAFAIGWGLTKRSSAA